VVNPFDSEGNLKIDPMIFLQGVIDEQIEVLDLAAAGGLDFGIATLGNAVVEIAHLQIERAHATLVVMIAADDTWEPVEGDDQVRVHVYVTHPDGEADLTDVMVPEGVTDEQAQALVAEEIEGLLIHGDVVTLNYEDEFGPFAEFTVPS
jgi:hypothetical protein